MGILSDAGRSVLGIPKSAILQIEDNREKSLGGMGMSSVLASAAGALGGTLGAVASSLLGGPKYFRLHFNPSGLSLQVNSETVAKSDTRRNGENRLKHRDAPTMPSVDLTIPLIFDDVNIYDSFMLDKFTGGASATGVRNAGSAVASVLGKKWTVQKEVEGLLATLYNEYTRNVIFTWSNFSFAGQLSDVDAQYTMFSVSGRPVRATVNITIHQEIDSGNLEGWYDECAEAFKGTSLLSAVTGTVGNMLNVNL